VLHVGGGDGLSRREIFASHGQIRAA